MSDPSEKYGPWMAYGLSVAMFVIAYGKSPSFETYTAMVTVGLAFMLILEGNKRRRGRGAS